MTHSAHWQKAIPSPSQQHRETALARQGQLTKPAGSLGRLEAMAVNLASLQHSDTPAADRISIAVFAADHGVCAEGISAFPQAVTGQMIANFVAGGAAISVMARHLGATLEVINLGTATPPPVSDGVIDDSIAAGTANLARQSAMSTMQLEQALAAGDRAAQRAADQQAQLFIGGEMGIGNTTSASAVACALLADPAAALAGPGTGLDAEGVSHKITVIERALARHGNNREPLAVLASLGGFEIAALAGAMIGCAVRGIPVLVDGFIVTVAALDAEPVLNLSMRLGEGSGAAVAVPVIRSACALHNNMATFADAGVASSQ